MPGSGSTANALNWNVGSSSTTPWSVQTPYLKQAFDKASAAYDKTMATGPYSGDYVAQDNGQGATAFNQAYNFGTGGDVQSYIKNLLGQSNSWVNQGADLINTGASGLKELAGDQTDAIIGSGGKYADNPYISDAVRAAMVDANRNAAENQVPNLYRSAAAGNALNSDRAALQQAIIERGLNDQASNISANMRYNAYNSGLDRALAEIENRRSNYGNIAGLGQTTASGGVNALDAGINAQSRLNQMAAAGAEGNRSIRQGALDNEMAKYQGNVNFPWQALNNFYSIIGDKSWGNNSSWSSIGGSSQQQQKNPSAMETAGSGLGAIGGLFGGGANSAANGLFSTAKGLFSFL